MRKTYISPEYKYLSRSGTLNMEESTSFFGSKMLDIEDFLVLDNSNVVYFQNSLGEQMNLNLEKNNTPVLYNTVDDKKNNHLITIDSSQSQPQLEANTRWLIEIDLKKILSNYLFAVLKQARTFEGIQNGATLYNNVNDAIKQYVDYNVINRYEFTLVEFYVEYVSLSTQGRLRFTNLFREMDSISNITTRIQSSTNFDKSKLKITFNQEQPSTSHVFDYYFVLNFTKI